MLLADRAGWHTTGELVLPKGINLFELPPYTPELQPTECAWPPLREATGYNRPVNDLDELEAILIERCRYFMRYRSKLKQHVGRPVGSRG